MEIAKIIFGAKNTDIKNLKEIVKIYALAGGDIFDVCANSEIINTAKNIIKNLNLNKKILICASITLADDVHAQKARILQEQCMSCQKCIVACPQNTIFEKDGTVKIDETACTGCHICQKICQNNAIEFYNLNQSFEEQFLEAKNADYIEIHTNGKTENLFAVFRFLKKNFDGEIGICISNNNNTDEKINIIEKIKEIIAPKTLIVQADGSSISGFDDNISTTQKAIIECKKFENIKNITLIASGGTNTKTYTLAQQENVNIDGIAWGSYARKIITETEPKMQLEKAKELIFSIRKNK